MTLNKNSKRTTTFKQSDKNEQFLGTLQHEPCSHALYCSSLSPAVNTTNMTKFKIDQKAILLGKLYILPIDLFVYKIICIQLYT